MPEHSSSPLINRRGFLRITAACGLAAGLSLPLVRQLVAAGELAARRETRLMLGTVIHLDLVSPDRASGSTAAQAALGEMQRLAGILDHRRADAALARLNAAGVLEEAPAELVQVLQKAIHFGALSQGAFDVSVKPVLDARAAGQPLAPELLRRVDYRQVQIDGSRVALGRPGMALTLDGIAKGWIIDATARVLREHGYENALVEAGGDLVAGGQNEQAQPWKVGISHPRAAETGQTLAVLRVSRAGLATSGDYRNTLSADFLENHIIDPRTGESPRELSSASVMAPCCADADALSTSLMVLGAERGLKLIGSLEGCEALVVGKDMKVAATEGFPRG